MDLLGDLGATDQLTSARSENAVLAKRVKELSEQVKVLTLENQQLLAEVGMYRKEAALPSFSNMALGKSQDSMMDVEEQEEFIKSGNGLYPSDPAVSLERLHGAANPLCCALHPEDAVLATGGADAFLVLCMWGAALAPTDGAGETVVGGASRIRCDAPVISVAFAQEGHGRALSVVAAGCMDGTVKLVKFEIVMGALQAKLLESPIKHAKYVKTLAWCPTAPILATASADGTVILTRVVDASERVCVEKVQTLHLPGAVEAMCFAESGETIYCYARGTPYLSCFDLNKDFELTKLNLNSSDVNGGFEDHVSFAVMDMAPSPNNGGKYLALATDTSRNIIINATTGNQVRNLYGHVNDGFSQPKIAWSKNGQYLFGNTQTDNSICVWDIASASIVKNLDYKSSDGHSGQIRDMCSSRSSDTLVTTSFDKTTKIWLIPA